MSVILDSNLVNRIKEIFQQEGGAGIDNLFLFTHIPPKRLKNAKSKYAWAMDNDEAAIILWDDTLFGSGKEGFVLTNKRLYSKETLEAGKFAYLSDIFDINIEHKRSSTKIIAKASASTLEIATAMAQNKENRSALFNILNKTVWLLKNSAGINQGQTIPAKTCQNCGGHSTPNAVVCEYCNSPL